jgi:hypothetical protein
MTTTQPERSKEPPWALSVPPLRFYNADFARHRPCPGGR